MAGGCGSLTLQGDESHMNFHFPLMPRMFMASTDGGSLSDHDILEQTPPIPDNCQWAIFCAITMS